MHFVVAWEPGKENSSEFALNLLNAFSGYRFAKALDTVYIVGVETGAEYAELSDKILDVGKTGDISMIVSPPIVGGVYGGWIPENLWAGINKISKGVGDD